MAGFVRVPVCSALLLAAFASSALARTYEPTKSGDPAPNGCKPKDCSLREAVIAANHHPGRDTIVLPTKGPYRLQIPPAGSDDETTGDLNFTSPFAIVHRGHGRAVIDAGGIDRAINVVTPTSGRYSKLSRILIRNGVAPDFGGGIMLGAGLLGLTKSVVAGNTAQSGGGVFAGLGELTLDRSMVTGNQATGGSGGGVETTVETDVRGSTIAGNHAGGEGGGIADFGDLLKVTTSRIVNNHAQDGAGGISTYGPTKIDRSTIAGNEAGIGVGGGIIDSKGPLTLTSSTVSNNRTTNDGGGIEVFGKTTLTNDTFTKNHADGSGGGVEVFGNSATLNAVTVARNSAGNGGGIGGRAIGARGFTVMNSLIALNTTTGVGPDCRPAPVITSAGHNLVGDTTGCGGSFGKSKHDITNLNPHIGKLAHNGGPTQTIALKASSKAVGHAGKSAPGRDQRGVRRDRHPDIGAFERK